MNAQDCLQILRDVKDAAFATWMKKECRRYELLM